MTLNRLKKPVGGLLTTIGIVISVFNAVFDKQLPSLPALLFLVVGIYLLLSPKEVKK